VKCSICTQTHRETKKANQPYRASHFILWDAVVRTCCTRQFEHQRDGTEAMRPRIIDWLCCVFWPTAIPYRLLNVPHRDQNCVANSALRHVLQWIRRMKVHSAAMTASIANSLRCISYFPRVCMLCMQDSYRCRMLPVASRNTALLLRTITSGMQSKCTVCSFL